MPEMPPSERDQLLERVLADYLHAAEAGHAPGIDELVASHPELADELRSFFSNRDVVERVAGPLRERGPALPETVGAGEPVSGEASKVVCYFGDYEILEEIARGGMGVVYRARQVSLNRVVALKMILAGQLASAADVRRFRQEAEAAANLDHPNIVPIYEVGEHDGQQYFSMKLIDGGNLGKGVAEGRCDQRWAAALLVRVARAIHFAHQRGILHRDLKPANILLDAQGQPHVSDFGLARHIHTAPGQTQSGAIVGTPGYMAPEQARSEKMLTTAVDVYSLGAVLFEMLTGQRPFNADTPLGTLLLVLEQDPKPPRSLRPEIDRDLETVCLKCLARNPGRRYGSAEALADDLEAWIAGRPIRARRIGLGERLLKWARRQPAVAALAAVVALATLVLLVGLSISNSLLQQERRQTKLALDERTVALASLGEQQRATAESLRRETSALARERQASYYHLIALAWREYQADNLPLASKRLEECHPDLRSWEWFYLRRLCHQPPPVIGSSPSLSTVHVVSPDGSRVAVARENGTTQVHALPAGKLLFTLKGHSSTVIRLAFSLDGKRLASTDDAGTVKVWDSDGMLLATLTGPLPAPASLLGRLMGRTPEQYRALAFSPDGKHLTGIGVANAGLINQAGGGVKVWDVATRKVIHAPAHKGLALTLAIDPIEGHLATRDVDGTIRVWERGSGKELHAIQGPPAMMSLLAYSPDGTRLAAWSSDFLRAPWSQDFRPSGSEVTLWDPRSGKRQVGLRDLRDHVTALAWTPDGQRLATASYKLNRSAEVKLHDARTGEELFVLRGQPDRVPALGFSKVDGRLIVVGSDGSVGVRDVRHPPEARQLDGFISADFSLDGKRVASGGGGGTVKVWDVETGREVRSLSGHRREVLAVAFSPKSDLLASVGEDSTIRIHDADSGQLVRTLSGHRQRVASLTFSPDGNTLASAGYEDGSIKLWDVATGRCLRTVYWNPTVLRAAFWPWPGSKEFVAVFRSFTHHDQHRVAFSPDGRSFASGDVYGTVKLWETATGREVRSYRHGGLVASIAFSQDGRRLASAGSDRMVVIWEVDTGEKILTLTGHTQPVLAVAFCPGSDRLVSGSADETVRVWDGQTGREVLTLSGHGQPVTGVTFSPDGGTLATPGGGRRLPGQLRLWDGRSLPLR